jgi:hypothetical protein
MQWPEVILEFLSNEVFFIERRSGQSPKDLVRSLPIFVIQGTFQTRELMLSLIGNHGKVTGH